MPLSDIRSAFPFLSHREDVVYLDTAASAQKPRVVLEEMFSFLQYSYSNIHRGAHFLGDEATDLFETARRKIMNFLGASSVKNIILTKNATEALNLVARSMDGFLNRGDTILLTGMEHHANLVPWQQLAQRTGAKLEFLEMDANKDILFEEEKVKRATLFAFCHVSNVLGTRNPVDEWCRIARQHNTTTVVDGCQSVAHFSVDVEKMGCDFYAFSGHKLYGPSGIGVLFGREEWLEKLPPFLGGGDMIRSVEREDFISAELPHMFEAGTPPIEATIGLGRAIDFLKEVGMENIEKHGKDISSFARDLLFVVPRVDILSHQEANGLLTFDVTGLQNYDISDALSEAGICIRVGHHCADPLHETMGKKTTLRASFGMYTTEEEIKLFTNTLWKIIVALA